MYKVSAKELLSWIKTVTCCGEDKSALYLLLDLVAGISSQDLNSIRIDSSKEVYLRENLNTINKYWFEFINEKKPIQYLCGNSYWRDFKLKVSSDVLIPRIETEQIVDIVINLSGKQKKILFADLGTGSGAIAISLSLINKNWTGLATDISINALNIAKENFKTFSKFSNLQFYCGNWWEPLVNYAGEIEIAVSNPPYIPSEVFAGLPTIVKKYEPFLALHGGDDGLNHINQIIKFAPKFLKKGGWLVLENHFDQANKVCSLFKDNGFESIEIINDFSGIGRFTIARYK